MFTLFELVNRWRKEKAPVYRLAPLDWWMEDVQPLAINPPAVLGRSSKADVRLTDPWTSRIHCELTVRDGRLMVRDLESRHGVFVNGERVTQSVLHRGDVLLLGVSRYAVEYDEAPEPIEETQESHE